MQMVTFSFPDLRLVSASFRKPCNRCSSSFKNPASPMTPHSSLVSWTARSLMLPATAERAGSTIVPSLCSRSESVEMVYRKWSGRSNTVVVVAMHGRARVVLSWNANGLLWSLFFDLYLTVQQSEATRHHGGTACVITARIYAKAKDQSCY